MNKNRSFIIICLSLSFAACSGGSDADSVSAIGTAGAATGLDRSVLPIPDPVFPKITEVDARKAVAPPAFSVTAPEGAPNVVIVLIDDIGFGASDGFGGGIQTPYLNRLADDGLRFNQVRTKSSSK